MELTSVKQIDRRYRHIYLSPHFDDVVMSCGGSIGLQTACGLQALVITAFASAPAQAPHNPLAEQAHQKMGLPDNPQSVVEARRKEDAAAVSTLGTDYLWLDLHDAIYRGAPAYYQNDEALFGEVVSGDFPLEERLATILQEVLERAPTATLYAPLGIGHHVDHQLCCSAAYRLAQPGAHIKFYEDFPYVATAGTLERRVSELGGVLEQELVEVSGALRLKEEAIAQYSSQVPQLFGSVPKMERAVENYMGSLRVTYPGIEIERYWATR
ncbi:MAG TPA: PIG-L family deacetylase [Ktedonobacterales bacterium]